MKLGQIAGWPALLNIYQSIKFFQLSAHEKAILRQVRQPQADIESILAKECRSIDSYVKLAIYSDSVRECCRQHFVEFWQSGIASISQWPAFLYSFNIQKTKLSLFDLMAGLLLLNEYFRYEQRSQQIVILYVAMNVFNSFYATRMLAGYVILALQKTNNETLIPPMVSALAKCAQIHGAPGYLIFSLFNQRLGDYFFTQGEIKEDRAEAAIYMGYIYLLAARKLIRHCQAELTNAAYGRADEKIQPVTLCQSMMNLFETNYGELVESRKIAAEKTADDLVAKFRF